MGARTSNFDSNYKYNENTCIGEISSFTYTPGSIQDLTVETNDNFIFSGVNPMTIVNNMLYLTETCMQRINVYHIDCNEHIVGNRNICEVIGCNIINPLLTTYVQGRSSNGYAHVNGIASMASELYVIKPYLQSNKLSVTSNPSISRINLVDGIPTTSVDVPIEIPSYSNDYQNYFFHNLVQDPNMANTLLILSSDCTVRGIDAYTGIESKNPITFNNFSESNLITRGLTYDGSNYVVGCFKSLRVMDSIGSNIHSWDLPILPMEILRV
jgi:hypothetical protein